MCILIVVQMFDLIGDLDVSDDIYENAADREAAVAWQQSEVDPYIYDEEGDEDEDEDVRDGVYGKKFPPKPSDWREKSCRQLPHVTYDMARIDLWAHGKDEISFFLLTATSSIFRTGQ